MAPIPNQHEIYRRARDMTPAQLQRAIRYHRNRAIGFGILGLVSLAFTVAMAFTIL